MNMFDKRLKGGEICTYEIETDENGKRRPVVTTAGDDSHFYDLSKEEQDLVLLWLKWNVYPARNVLNGHSSYGMKHYLEHRTNIYLTNNQMKEAMFVCGFFPAKVDELNWRFRIKASSPIFKTQIDGRLGLPLLGFPMDYSSGYKVNSRNGGVGDTIHTDAGAGEAGTGDADNAVNTDVGNVGDAGKKV